MRILVIDSKYDFYHLFVEIYWYAVLINLVIIGIQFNYIFGIFITL